MSSLGSLRFKCKNNNYIRGGEKNNRSLMSLKTKKLFIIFTAFYLVFVCLAQIPFLAEEYTPDSMVDSYTAKLKFSSDGKTGHYYVERYETTELGQINVQYITKSNSLEVDCINIKVLRIYCREMYDKKSEEIFGTESELDSNYYKTYFINRDQFHVHVYTIDEIDQLVFIDAPTPYNVTVNGQEWWLTGVNYTYNDDGMIFTRVPAGHNYIDIYFKSNQENSPIADFSVSKSVLGLDEYVAFDASASIDPDGMIISYVWDFSDGTFKGGVQTKHKFSSKGKYKVILTVTDDDYLISRAYKEINVIERVMTITSSVDKPIATPGSILNYTYQLSLNSTWTGGVKDIEVKSTLPDELDFVTATPLPEISNNTVIWRLGFAFENEELPELNLQVIINDKVKNNTIIVNSAVLNYQDISGRAFPEELSNQVNTQINFGSILAPRIKMKVNDVLLKEDSPPYNLFLNAYEYDFTDPGETLRWYLTGENESLYLISGEHSDNDIITITPIPNQFGSSMVTLWLIDSEGYTTSQPLWINITPVNDPPLISKTPDLILHYGEPYVFDYEPYIFDIDTSKSLLTIFIKENLGFDSNSNLDEISESTTDLGLLEGEHYTINGFRVTYEFPVTYVGKQVFMSLVLFDGSSSDGETIKINITDDHTPKLQKELPDVQLAEGEKKENVFDIDDYFIDPDEDSLFYSIGETHIKVDIHFDHTVDITAPPDWNGVDSVTFRARDPIGAIAEDTILVTVTPFNDPPIITGVPDTFIVHYDADYHFDLTPYITDEDNSFKELELLLEDRHIRIDPANNLKIIMNYPKSMVGQEVPVSLAVTDGIEISSQDVVVKVTENWPPEIQKEIPDITFNEDDVLQNALNLNDYFSDKDSNALYYTYGQNFVKIMIAPDGSVGFSAETDWFGNEVVTFRATDNTEAFVESVIRVTVLPVNDPPVLKTIPNQSGSVNELWRVDLNEYIEDIDNDISELKLTAESGIMDINIKGREILIYSNVPLLENLTIVVSDGEAETTGFMMVEIKDDEPSSSQADDNQIMVLIILLIIIVIILSISGYTAYRRYNGNYKIEEIFCISNNGLLISHLSLNSQGHRADEQIVSSMLTAIINFTQEAFTEEEKNRKAWSIKEIQMNEKNIMVDRGEYTYLATVFIGKSGKKLYSNSKKLLNNLETKYKIDLLNWNGNLNTFKGMDQYLKSMISK